MKHLLLLHGYTQNSNKYNKTMSKLLSKTFIGNYKVICPNGCYTIDEHDNKLGWWKLDSPQMFTKPHKYIDFDKAIKYVQDHLPTFKENDTLDIIAFSQGSVIVEYMLANKLFQITPNKVVLFSPSGIMDEKYNKIKIAVDNVLIVMGEKEGIFGITKENYKIVSCLEGYKTYIHKQGHVIPTNSKTKISVKDFLNHKP